MKTFKELAAVLKESAATQTEYKKTPEGHVITPDPIHFKHIDGVHNDATLEESFAGSDPFVLKDLEEEFEEENVKRTKEGHIILDEPIHFKYPHG